MREQSLNANVAFRAALAGQLDVGRYSVLLKKLLHCHLRLDRDQSKGMIDEMSEREYEKLQSGIKRFRCIRFPLTMRPMPQARNNDLGNYGTYP